MHAAAITGQCIFIMEVGGGKAAVPPLAAVSARHMISGAYTISGADAVRYQSRLVGTKVLGPRPDVSNWNKVATRCRLACLFEACCVSRQVMHKPSIVIAAALDSLHVWHDAAAKSLTSASKCWHVNNALSWACGMRC